MEPLPLPPKRLLPLQGQRILLTRSSEASASLRASLEGFGAEVKCIPLLSIQPTLTETDLQIWRPRLRAFDWIALTSANATRAFVLPLASEILALRRLSSPGLKIACVGEATASPLADVGLSADLSPQKSHALGLVEAFQGVALAGQRIVWPTSNLARPALVQGLREAGYIVEIVIAYRTDTSSEESQTLRDLLASTWPTIAVVASPSAAEALAAYLQPPKPPPFRLASIGPTTSAALRDLGWFPAIQPSRPSVEDLTSAIVEACLSE